jgi:hypothetical protein
MAIKFTPAEIANIEQNPEAIRLVAEYHEIQITMGEPMEDLKIGLDLTSSSRTRKAELLAEADRLQAEYES